MKMWQPSTSRLVSAFPRRFIENGVPATGTKNITFRFFTADSGGTLLTAFTGLPNNTEETHTNVPMGPGGVFNVFIGSVSIASGGAGVSAAVFGGDTRWIEVQVGSEVLDTRTRLVSVPYAYHADFAQNATTATFSINAGTATWATNAGTATWATQAGSVVSGGAGSIPAGAILPYGGSTAPPEFLLCNGSTVTQSSPYDKLFSAISTNFNTGGEPSGTFRLPDLRGRFPLGVSTTHPLAETAGHEGIPFHSHGFSHEHEHNIEIVVGTVDENENSPWRLMGAGLSGSGTMRNLTQAGSANMSNMSSNGSVSNAGDPNSTNNLSPYQTVNYIIKY